MLVANDKQQRHELLHFEGVAHHHDDHDDGVHEDESMASTMHVLADAIQFSPAVPSSLEPVLSLSGSDRPTMLRPHAHAWLFPKGLDRPPKHTA